jgi:hypothetical protein
MENKFFRECPNCKKKLEYSSKKGRNRAEKVGTSCLSCSLKEAHKRPEVILGDKRRALERKKRYKGEGNPFFGKKHTKESLRKIKIACKKMNKKKHPSYQSEEFKEKSKRCGKDNGMYGRSIYDVWVEKYGKEEADSKMVETKAKLSKASSGKNNPMYGRPSPKGAGNGWSGWYKGWYFRSLRELSYMIKVIEKNRIEWKSAERKINIKYVDYDGKERTYRPDFILENKILIEIKPKKLMETPNNIRKKEAAVSYCEKNGFEYRMVDIKIMDTEEIINLWQNKKIKFIKKYEECIKKYLK